eukprot:jgi/Botrbrau1/17497/Bobra.0054s0077.2
MALIETELPDEALKGFPLLPGACLTLRAPGMQPLQVPLHWPPGKIPEMLEIEVWDWRGPARNEGKAAEAWLSSYLGRPCRLLRYMGGLREGERKEDRARRPAGNSYQWAHPNVFCDGSWLDQTDVTFPDQFPLLIANEASLADLNRQMQDKVPMNRFRPNIVIAGAAPWAEDAWASLTVVHKTGGGTLAPLAIHSIAPCSRCKITTTDQATGEVGEEPLKSLNVLRSGKALGWDKALPHIRELHPKVFFGYHCIVKGKGGVISVGDEVEVREERKPLGSGDTRQVAMLLGSAVLAAMAVPAAVYFGTHLAKQ